MLNVQTWRNTRQKKEYQDLRILETINDLGFEFFEGYEIFPKFEVILNKILQTQIHIGSKIKSSYLTCVRIFLEKGSLQHNNSSAKIATTLLVPEEKPTHKSHATCNYMNILFLKSIYIFSIFVFLCVPTYGKYV
jgi:hypothetical protein